MSAHVEYRCDICAITGVARYERYGIGVKTPKGWKSYDGKHLCGYECLSKLIEELAMKERVAAKLDPAPDGAA